MGIWAILPVKPFGQGKSRLAGVLNDENRVALNRCLFEHTLKVLTEVEQISHVLVISRDSQALSMARRFQALTLLENGNSNLNQSLEIAAAMARRRTNHGVLAIPADLPLLAPEDIAGLLAFAGSPPVVAIAPDRHGLGTNGLFVSPPGLIRFNFGLNSFVRHSEAALQAGACLEIVRTPSLMLDLDLPEDLDLLRRGGYPLDEIHCIQHSTATDASIAA